MDDILSSRELWGWYMFDFGCYSYVSAVLVVFIPIVLDNLAWMGGSQLDGSPCVENNPCFVQFGFFSVRPDSFVTYIIGLSVFLQVFSFISFGAFADYANYRKKFLIGFSLISIICCFAFLLIVNASMELNIFVLIKKVYIIWLQFWLFYLIYVYHYNILV